jgi:hypothetical protein
MNHKGENRQATLSGGLPAFFYLSEETIEATIIVAIRRYPQSASGQEWLPPTVAVMNLWGLHE